MFLCSFEQHYLKVTSHLLGLHTVFRAHGTYMFLKVPEDVQWNLINTILHDTFFSTIGFLYFDMANIIIFSLGIG